MSESLRKVEGKGLLGKYKALIFSLCILVFLVVALLGLNLYFSRILEKTAETTAAAGRQATLVQQVSKDIFLLNSLYQQILPYRTEASALNDTMDLFSSTLNAFSEGGTVLVFDESTSQPKQVEIDRLNGPDARAVVDRASTIWEKYKVGISPVLEDRQHSQSELIEARAVAEENNNELSSLMDQLSDQIQAQSETNINYLKYFQIAGIFLTALVFFWTVFVTLRNLRKNDDELDLARQETTGILNTVKEGLFLLDNSLIIGSQHSNETLEIFEQDQIQGREFGDFLSDVLEEIDPDVMQSFVKLLFDEHVIEELIGNLNPLDRVETTFKQSDGSVATKFLNFDFFRVMRRGVIEQVLVSVRDITARVLLEKELESTKEQGEQQVEMLVSFLKADSKLLKSFLLQSRESLSDVNTILKDPLVSKQDLKNKLDKMFISIHRMKGEASAMNFEAFAEKAHDFEDGLTRLKKVTNIKGIDFLPLTIELDKLISYVDTLNELSARIASGKILNEDTVVGENTVASGLASVEPSPVSTSRFNHLQDLAKTVAKDSGKKVELISTGLAEIQLSEDQERLVNDVSIQLIRNAIIHGIETPEVRLNRRKADTGRIDLRLASLADGRVELVLRDDGNGLDVASIKKRIVEKGLATASEMNTWSEQKIVSMAFTSGFSTSKEASMHAGRGVGLDLIRDGIKKIGGHLRLRQAAGKYCQFEIVLPASTNS